MAHTGRTLEELDVRDLCDYVEYTLFERANDKQAKHIQTQLNNAHHQFVTHWNMINGVYGSTLIRVAGLRKLLPAQPNGMAVGHDAGEE